MAIKTPNCFVKDVDATFMQDVFHLTKPQWIAHVIDHCHWDDLGEVLKYLKGQHVVISK